MKNNFDSLIKSHFKEHAFVLQSTSLKMINKLEKASSHLSKVLLNGKKFFGVEMGEVHQIAFIFQQNS